MGLPRFCIALLLGGTLFAASAEAHPHVWIDYRVRAEGDAKGVRALSFLWDIDSMFTSMVKGDFKLKTITPKDSALIRHKAFDNLRHYHYFLDITADGSLFHPQEKDVRDFQVSEIGGREKKLRYSFRVVLPKPAKKLSFSLADPDFYVDIGPPMIAEGGKTGLSLMRDVKYKPAPFVKADAKPTGAFTCGFHEGKPRVSSLWGSFKLFIVTCEVKPS